MIKAVIFDSGGVLHAQDDDVKNDVAEALGLSLHQVIRIWHSTIVLLGTGEINEPTFWKIVCKTYDLDPVAASSNLLGKGFASRFQPFDSVLAFCESLRQRGLVTAVLSNTIEPHAKVCQAAGVYAPFDHVFLSHRIRLLKPDPAAYRYALAQLALEPVETAFIDDRRDNVEAAREIGMHGLVFASIRQLRERLGVILEREGMPSPTRPR